MSMPWQLRLVGGVLSSVLGGFDLGGNLPHAAVAADGGPSPSSTPYEEYDESEDTEDESVRFSALLGPPHAWGGPGGGLPSDTPPFDGTGT